jgi:hypothetical protein
MSEIDDFEDWRAFTAANNWADFDANDMFHALVRASEKGDRPKERQLRIELEEFRDALVEIVPSVERAHGIEMTPDFKSPEEMSYTDRELERHMKWAAHLLRRTVDILQMDFSDPKPGSPSAIEDARIYLEDWLRENGSPELIDPAYLSPAERNTPLWHAMCLNKAITELDMAFALVGAPGAYREGKKIIQRHMAESADAAVRIGRHYEILRRKWSEPLAVAEQKQVAGRSRGSDTISRKHERERQSIIQQFDDLIAQGVTRANAVTQIARTQDSVSKGKNLETEKKRIRAILNRHHKDAWKEAQKHTP